MTKVSNGKFILPNGELTPDFSNDIMPNTKVNIVEKHMLFTIKQVDDMLNCSWPSSYDCARNIVRRVCDNILDLCEAYDLESLKVK